MEIVINKNKYELEIMALEAQMGLMGLKLRRIKHEYKKLKELKKIAEDNSATLPADKEE